MRNHHFVAVPPTLLAGIHGIKETICINEWTLAFALFVAFCVGWATVKIADRMFR